MANPRQLLIHLLLFEFELFLVWQVLPFASTTNAEVLAGWSSPYVAKLVEFNDFCFSITMLLASHLKVDHVAWYTIGYEYYQTALRRTVVFGDCNFYYRLTFCGDVGDGHLSEYW